MTANNGQETATALKWLYEMEAVDNPTLRSNLYENVFLADVAIKDCAVFILPTFTYQKGVMVWRRTTLWAKWFHKEEIDARIESVVKGLLPSYEVRIVDDKTLLTLAQERIEEIYGGQNEKSNITDSDTTSSIEDVGGTSNDLPVGEASDLLPDSKEQTENKQKLRNETKQSDLQIDEKAQHIIDDIYGDSDG